MSGANYYSLENEISSVTRMDAPLSKGPVARWQRKALETSASNSSNLLANISATLNSSKGQGSNSSSSSSSRKRLSSDSLRKTPSKSKNVLKTPSKLNGSSSIISPSRLTSTSILSSPSRLAKSANNNQSPSRLKGSPSRHGSTTPNAGADRFIPSRTGTDYEASRFKILHEVAKAANDQNSMSPSQLQRQKRLAESLHGGEMEKARIIAYQHKAPNAPETHSNGLKVLYSQTKASPGSAAKKTMRHIPQVPERILDAPEIVNDYYLNLLDWSANNFLAVALGPHIYLWNAANGEIQQLLELEGPEDYVCSVKWVKEGNFLAVGNSQGDVALWDVEHFKRLRLMNGHTDRVGSMSWNEYVLSSGSRSGKINHSDVRVAQHQVGSLSGHTQEVCGLAWSPDGKVLASGGNDNVLNLWPVAAAGHRYSENAPKYSFTQHQAAVKALAWCPWQPNILASGGGTADRCVRIWNSNNGTLLNTIDTKSQVCSVLWASEYKELVTAHGYVNNEVTIWKYPSMTKTAELLGHSERVLHLSLSPDGTTLVSAGADETLRLWKCFLPDPNKTKFQSRGKTAGSNILRGGIR